MSIRLAILISGSGSTAQAILRASNEHVLGGVTPVVVIASTPSAQGIQKAKTLGFPCEIVDRKNYDTGSSFGEALLGILKKYRVDFVSQNGWLPLTPKVVVKTYERSIINQHPGPLDPGSSYDFGGKGMFGLRVTLARVAFCWLTAHDYWTESTVHFVTDSYDQGDLISAQRLEIPVPKKHVTVADLKKDPTSLLRVAGEVAARLLLIEHANVLAVLRLLGAEGCLLGYPRETPLISQSEQQTLMVSKQLAQKLIP